MLNILLIGHGYIGSYLHERFAASNYPIHVVERDPERIRNLPVSTCDDYSRLNPELIRSSDVILWFAGHSSVPMSNADPTGAVQNNCHNLLDLLRLKPKKAKFIYASSASVYSVPNWSIHKSAPMKEDGAKVLPCSIYDGTKIAFDALAAVTLADHNNVTGLRMGTLSGWSPRIRQELLFNAMNLSAMNSGFVNLCNPTASRTILFLDDLFRIIESLINHKGDLPRILNCGSMNGTMSYYAEKIAAYHGAKINCLPDTKTYSFQMDLGLCQSITKASNYSLDDRIEQFKENVLASPTSKAN